MINPDFCKIADAYGIPAIRVTQRSEIEDAVARARAHEGGPIVVEFMVEKHDVVYPMVPSGATLNEMIRRPAATPEMV
jgi:acetolactate synthase-1/2/3 large subunit